MGDFSDWLVVLVPLRVWLVLAGIVAAIAGIAWVIYKLRGWQ